MEPQTREADALVNDLLRRMPVDEWALLKPHLTIVTLAYGQILFEDGEPSDMAYFPMTAVISMLSLMKNGDEVEYGSIGREGMVGLQVALDSQPLRGRAMCQLEGEAVILAREDMTKLTRENAPQLHRLLMRYAQSTINVLAQSAACNALHPMRQRMARWLLMTSDRRARRVSPNPGILVPDDRCSTSRRQPGCAKVQAGQNHQVHAGAGHDPRSEDPRKQFM